METLNNTRVKTLKVELLEVDMTSKGVTSCPSCDGIQARLLEAIKAVQPVFEQLNCEILFSGKAIKSQEEAIKNNFVASPTIRAGNLDFYPEHNPAQGEERTWSWSGKQFSDPGKEVLIEVILKGYFKSERSENDAEISPYVKQYFENAAPVQECSCGSE